MYILSKSTRENRKDTNINRKIDHTSYYIGTLIYYWNNFLTIDLCNCYTYYTYYNNFIVFLSDFNNNIIQVTTEPIIK